MGYFKQIHDRTALCHILGHPQAKSDAVLTWATKKAVIGGMRERRPGLT